jgi:hypothetical protein
MGQAAALPSWSTVHSLFKRRKPQGKNCLVASRSKRHIISARRPHRGRAGRRALSSDLDLLLPEQEIAVLPASLQTELLQHAD